MKGRAGKKRRQERVIKRLRKEVQTCKDHLNNLNQYSPMYWTFNNMLLRREDLIKKTEKNLNPSYKKT